MKRVATSGGLALALLVCAAAAAPAQPLFSPTQDPLAGARVFGAKGCVKCHAIDGVGGKVGPDLARVPPARSFFDLAAALWNHAPRMAERMRQLGIARPQLEPQEAANLVAFLFTLDYFDRKGRAEVGRRLFTEKRCVACHQVAGRGGVVGPPLDAVALHGSPIALAAAMWNHGPQMTETMKARSIPRPAFKEGELADLMAYLKSVAPGSAQEPLHVLPGRADEGLRVFVNKRCVDCHSVGRTGARVGPDLAERALHRSLTEFAAAMWNKAPTMLEAMRTRAVPVPQLTPEEMADLVALLYSVRYFAEPGDPASGVRVATAKGCLTCHGLHGERGKVASDLARATTTTTPGGVLSALWNHSFIGDPRPPRDRAPWAAIRPEEMADLIAYLRSLRRPR